MAMAAATLDIAQLNHILEIPHADVTVPPIVTSPNPNARTFAKYREALLALCYIADQLVDTLRVYGKHKTCNVGPVPELKKLFVRSVHWQFHELLEEPYKQLKDEMRSMNILSQKFGNKPVLKCNPVANLTYGHIFKEFENTMDTLFEHLMKRITWTDINRNKDSTPTRCPTN